MIEKVFQVLIFGIAGFATMGILMVLGIQPFAVEAGTFTTVPSLLDSRVLMAVLLSIIAGVVYGVIRTISDELYLFYDQEIHMAGTGSFGALMTLLMASAFVATGNLIAWAVAMAAITVISMVAMLISSWITEQIFEFHEATFYSE